MIKDAFTLAVQNLTHRKVRSWLTMIGIFIGITAVIAVVSLGQGLEAAINEQFAELGTDKIFIQPGSSAFGGATSVVLDESDLRVVERTPGVAQATGMAYTNGRITYKDVEVYGLVMGVNLDTDLWASMNSKNVEAGRLLEDGDVGKAFVGYDFSQDDKLFPHGASLGDKFTINGVAFEIVGIQEDLGNSQDNTQVQVSAEAYERVFGERVEDEYMMLLARVDTAAVPADVAEQMKHDLRRHRGLDEGDEDFTLQTAEQFLESFNSILLIVQVVIVGIAAVSLLIGGIGIMNTMYTAVVERTQEIGIMKAIGARNSDVLVIFLIESGMLGLVGGAIGVATGLGLAKLVEIAGELWIGTLYLQMWWSWELILGALAFGFLVGALSGVAPAYQASKQKPVDSLRYE